MVRATESTSLPMPLTRFFGRRQEIAALSAQIFPGRARLLTLVGPGGVGKTRLALQASAEAQDRFIDGAVFVPLSAGREPDLVLPTLLLALDVEGDEVANPAERLKLALRQRELLLVLDNLEHVVSAGTALGELLVACPRLSLVGTSRIPLRIAGEQLIPVSPFPVPDVRHGFPGDLDSLAAIDAVGSLPIAPWQHCQTLPCGTTT